MLTKDAIEAQLRRLGINPHGWGSGEIYELRNTLMTHEEITACVHGWYDSGFATLVATTERLLLIDKKVFHLTIEDLRYDMIAEVDFDATIMSATMRVTSLNKSLRFTSMRQQRLRDLTLYVQRRVMEMRQQMFSSQQFIETAPLQNLAMAPQFKAAPAAAGPALATPMRRLTNPNPYTKTGLTTKHYLLPKVPRRWRPSL